MKLAIMTKSTFFVEEDKILAALFDVGLDNLHLYKPETSPIYSERLLSLLPDKAYEKIFVHGHYYLKDEYRLAGIHLDNSKNNRHMYFLVTFSTVSRNHWSHLRSL